jgi:DNA-binding NarL/FixJ family response regulator
MIRVLVVDDHPAMRRGLGELIDDAEGLALCCTAADAEEAVAAAESQSPDVVLMDVSMPGTNGVEATRRVLAVAPQARVVMMTSYARHEFVLDSLDAGAVGYLLKDAAPDEILRGIRAAAAGETPLSARAATALIDRRRTERTVTELTPRERDVLSLLVRGLSNKQIAWRLGIKEKTVKAHLANLFARHGFKDRVQAAMWAREHGVGET